jgi:hypothetical protein
MLNLKNKGMKKRIKYLESLLPIGNDFQAKYGANFDKYATYMSGGVCQWKGLLSTDTAELFLMGVLKSEKIEFDEY